MTLPTLLNPKKMIQFFSSSLSKQKIIHFTPNKKEKELGFHYKGVKFVHHSTLAHEETAFFRLTGRQSMILGLLFFALVGFLYINWQLTVTAIVAIVTGLYFIDLIFSAILIKKSFSHSPEIDVTEEEIRQAPQNAWPTYTILCPLYKEAQVIPQFVKSIQKLDYPKNKLQVLLLLEEDDTESLTYVAQHKLPSYFSTIVVPHSLPKTKPKALNYGLKKATGRYLVVYDAEDIPEPAQLKKTVLAYRKSPSNTLCIQAKLNFYNPHQNLLTRLFTAEYALWFDLILVGLQSVYAPIPLGGTSNHFDTKLLKKIHAWDSFNVTEDCDLGMRLAKKGYQTAIINSITMEEANSSIKNWFAQRTRWIKGYIQTYLVHMRRPSSFFTTTSKRQFIMFQLIAGGKVLSLLLNPLMWATTISYFAFRSTIGVFIERFFPAPVLYMGVISLIFGNFLYLYLYMIACAKRKHYVLIKYIYLVPLYWIALSIATWKALAQFIVRPHFWPKTIHGLHLPKLAVKIKVEPRIVAPAPSIRPAYAFSKPPKQLGGFAISIVLGIISRILLIVVAIGDAMISIVYLLFKDFRSVTTSTGKRSRRILILNWRDTKHKYAGGAEAYLHELAKRWVKKGYEVTLFCGNDRKNPSQEMIDGVEVIRRGGFYLVYVWAFIYYMLFFRGKFDVIIDCQNGIPFFAPLYTKEPVYCLMFHVHQEVFFKSLTRPFADIAAFIENKCMPVVYKNIHFLTISNSSASEITKLGLGRSGITVIHPGVDISLFKPAKKSETPLVLYVGRLKFYKSVDLFIRTASLVLKSMPTIKFVIAGDGEERRKLKKLAKKLNLDNQVSFLGRVSEKKKISLYQKAWAFVNPSSMEGWGLTTIEASATATPVVASDVPGLRESVQNPHMGYLVEYGNVAAMADKVLKILKDANLRNQLSKSAVLWARKFDWDKSAKKALRVLEGDITRTI